MRGTLVLLAAVSAFAGQASRLGSWEGSLLRMGGGARELSLGNAALADAAAQPAAFWNPALVPLARGLSMSLSGERRTLDRVGGAMGVSKGVGGRMGVGLAVLWRADADFAVIDEEDRDLGSAMPWTGWADVAVGWRLSRASSVGASIGYMRENWGVAKYFADVDLVDEHASAAAFTMGWHHEAGRFAWAVVARNIGFGENASVAWTRTTSRSNQLYPSRGVIPKSLEAGCLHRSKLMGKPLRQQIQVLDYQLADTLAAFDHELHAMRARYGVEWEAFAGGAVRFGYDAGTFAAGAGYLFRPRMGARRLPLQLDYALLLERNAGFSPFSLGTSVHF